MKRAISLLLTLVLVLGACLSLASCQPANDYTVGVVQLMKHDSLDEATKGFVDALNKKMEEAGKTVDIQVTIAGDVDTCPTAVGVYVSQNVDLIMANATPALTAASNATATIPILGTSVTSYEDTYKSGIPSNVGGTSDAVPFDEQAQKMIDTIGLVEGDKVGVIYCSSESNSVFQYNAVKEYLEGKGIVVGDAYTFSEISELQATVVRATSECKAIFVPSDNTVSQNEAIVDTVARETKTPVFTSYGGPICYCSLAISYYDLGYRTGEMAAEILLGNKTIADFEIETLVPTVAYNEELCELLGIAIPEEN